VVLAVLVTVLVVKFASVLQAATMVIHVPMTIAMLPQMELVALIPHTPAMMVMLAPLTAATLPFLVDVLLLLWTALPQTNV